MIDFLIDIKIVGIYFDTLKREVFLYLLQQIVEKHVFAYSVVDQRLYYHIIDKDLSLPISIKEH